MRLCSCTSLVMALAVAASATIAVGQQAQTPGRVPEADGPSALAVAPSLAWLSLQPQGENADVERIDVAVEESSPSPLSFGLEYSVYTDYVFRGINFSEFPREGRELLNHQLSVDFGVDLGLMFERDAGSLGTLSFNTWFEWFAGQKKIDPASGGQNFQEVDYSIAWSYDIEPIATTLTLGYVFFSFPNAKTANSQEWTVSLEHNDAWLWKWLWPSNEDSVLNPTFFYAMDVQAGPGGSWIELGISHDFAIAKNLTVSPGVTLAIDHRYLDPILGTGRQGGTRLAYVQYGLNIGYDLSQALKLSEKASKVTMSGFLFFNDALGNPEDQGLIQDEFFGGVSIGWAF